MVASLKHSWLEPGPVEARDYWSSLDIRYILEFGASLASVGSKV